MNQGNPLQKIENTLLIIDDNLKLCHNLNVSFSNRGYSCFYATTGNNGIKLLQKEDIRVVLLDIRLKNENGLDVLKSILALKKSISVIMMTGYGTIETAVEAIKQGAFDFVQKPCKIDQLAAIVEKACRISRLEEKNREQKPKADSSASRFVTRSQEMIALCKKVAKVAETNLPILIYGESGTGKELIADFIHAHSSRSHLPMQKINCTSFPEHLLDNELFGHEKGAFTGAQNRFQGVFERADNSSLFMDELGDMPLSIQAKILRTVQNQEIRRLGGKDTLKVNVRFICATNRNIESLISQQKFRTDLYYRLNTAVFKLPPLKDRKEDIMELAEYFLRKFTSSGKKQFSNEVCRIFFNHDWPGNVRELKSAVLYAAALSLKDVIEPSDLPPAFFKECLNTDNTQGNIREMSEKKLILQTLKEAYYNKKKTAELLHMSRSTLYLKLEKYGISTKQG